MNQFTNMAHFAEYEKWRQIQQIDNKTTFEEWLAIYK